MSRFTPESAARFLENADVFYSYDASDPDEDGEPHTLNMNDVWGWALAWGEKVPDEELVPLAELVWHYGWCGCLYWVSERHGKMRSEFHDITRAVEFVRHEVEHARGKTSRQAAYTPLTYTLGAAVTQTDDR